MTDNYFMYRISSPNYPECYVGSTKDFTKRKAEHRRNLKKDGTTAYNYKVYQFIRENGGWEAWTMEQLEVFRCDTKTERLLREKALIDIHKATLNTISPFQTREEMLKYKADWALNYRATRSEEKRDEYNSKQTALRLINKDSINAKLRERRATDEEYRNHKKKLDKEYYISNPEKVKAHTKKYYDANRELLCEKASTYGFVSMTCGCGRVIKRSSKSNHIRSTVHKKWLETQEPTDKIKKDLVKEVKLGAPSRQRYDCGCGVNVINAGSSRHNKSKKHIAWEETR